jgi:hypothetical protein
LNDGTGAFTGPSEYITSSASHRFAADFTGDGKPDVFSVNSTDRPMFSLYVNVTP